MKVETIIFQENILQLIYIRKSTKIEEFGNLCCN